MRKILLVALALMLGSASLAVAGDCAGCGAKVSGYMAPYFKLYDHGEDYSANKGFGVRYNRVVFSGMQEGNKLVKNLAYRVETDLAETGAHGLQWVYVEPYFNENFSVRMGRVKEAFSREILHSTANQITVQRHPASTGLGDLSYGQFSYGMEARFKNEMFTAAAGIYDGMSADKDVRDQDPAFDFGARVVAMPMEGLEIGANALMVTLPAGGVDGGMYVDSTYTTNTGLAYGADFCYMKSFDEKMSLWIEGEFGMGDNHGLEIAGDAMMVGGAWVEKEDGTTAVEYEDLEWDSFMYYYLKARFMVTPEFGIHIGYSMWDPNTNSDAMAGAADAYEIGENNELTWITPGVVYMWSKNFRTQAEVQIVNQKVQDWVDITDPDKGFVDDLSYTHFVLQTIFLWP